ncbi:aspartate/glutamate racemase family protein [Bordetella avium]|uniref:aspartate/glutamate racemase family protein n=1 Tax=Bordetella avium TaxID=521 RepID=UPI000E09FAF7|nr:aspartate/glutamate racemase family protein [Bordetella avium]AZY51612.1 Asp/Glu racemase [Bordetella avium]RIQ13525.1 Asp/Glu racemase [Bordetella avium]RIQ36872.1 Asp/Glu racemase [Bordetella avium]RIQ40663.1 Asp/Glu racemase [Bordetella avium]RIQ42512.1 Asp/Glu racemase [Bordetella avium]
MVKTLYVINPNSDKAVTRGIEAALAPLSDARHPLECVTIGEGPPGIQSQRDVDAAAVMVRDFAERHREQAAGFITACFSDPGLHSLREMPGVIAMGISEGAALSAMAMGDRFGVIAMAQAAIPRHMRAWRAMGVAGRVAGEVAIGRTVAELADADATLAAMVAAGKTLKDQYRADVLIMGCAGMASYREALQAAVGLPVVEPSQATAALVLGRLRLGW